jgi:indolepyruvate ferredoxin oxidoreductase
LAADTSRDLVLGCDLVVSGTKKVLAAIEKDETGVFVNTAEVYPGDSRATPTSRCRRSASSAR